MRATLTVGRRGRITLPARLRAATGLAPGNRLVAELTPEGILLRPAVTLPIEIYDAARIAEFDAAEAETAAVLASRGPGQAKRDGPR